MEIPLSRFKGHAVGIDLNAWIFAAKSSAMKDSLRLSKDPLEPLDPQAMIDNIIKQFYGVVYKICNVGVTPVWIYDGDKHPLKIATDERKKVKKSRMENIVAERERIRQLSRLERELEIKEFVKILLNCVSPTRDEMEALKEEIVSLGVPLIKAPYDGEILAAAMSKARLLMGVWTTDTDVAAAGSLIKIDGFSRKHSVEGVMIEVFCVSYVLDALGITQEQFRDFCILHECDFNQRIPKMGPAKILQKMEQYDWDLDAFIKAEPGLPWDLVNVEECRKIFDGPDVSEIKISDLIIDKKKWNEKMKTKSFEIEYPPYPKMVSVVS